MGIHLHYLAYTLLGLVNREDTVLNSDAEWMHSTFQKELCHAFDGREYRESVRLFVHLCREAERAAEVECDGVLARVEAYIHEHYMENISLKLLGEHFS